MGDPRRGRNVILGCVAVVGAFTVIGALVIDAAVPESEAPDVIAHVGRLADGLESETNDFFLFDALSVDAVLECLLLWVGTVFLIDEEYLQNSGISDNERAVGCRQLAGFVHCLRGWYLVRAELRYSESAALESAGSSDSSKLKNRANVSDDDIRGLI